MLDHTCVACQENVLALHHELPDTLLHKCVQAKVIVHSEMKVKAFSMHAKPEP
jgi:hypothetical protein